ncbi:Protein of unknown function [Gryllus bimaculatus]|nr:Protein of unknown function [Gryllus bimaculatus]
MALLFRQSITEADQPQEASSASCALCSVFGELRVEYEDIRKVLEWRWSDRPSSRGVHEVDLGEVVPSPTEQLWEYGNFGGEITPAFRKKHVFNSWRSIEGGDNAVPKFPHRKQPPLGPSQLLLLLRRSDIVSSQKGK